MSGEPGDSVTRAGREIGASTALQLEGSNSAEQQLVAVRIANQTCGIPVLLVRDVLGDQRVAPIPLTPPEIAGSLNLRGRIVTAISVRRKLGLPAPEHGESMAVVVEYDRELYALLVDYVAEVISVEAGTLKPNPSNLTRTWATVSAGIYPLESCLLVVLDVGALLAKPNLGA